MLELLEVAAGGLLGAPVRFILDHWINSRTEDVFPWGTFVINATGAFVLGLVSGLAIFHGLGRAPVAVIGIGFCGSYTTFSTFSYETMRLVEEGALISAVSNVAGSLFVGILAAGAGLALAAAI